MSGHNKWSKIKRAKGAADAKRSKQYSNILKQVAIAVREGGPDPDSNPRLRLLVQNARGCNMPKDTLQRAINKANDKDAAAMQELTFECHVNHGIALFIEALSDNNNRTVANVKSIMNKFGGTLETNGSLSFLFTRKGVFSTEFVSYEYFGDHYFLNADIECESAELQRIPNTTRSIDEESIRKVLKVINILEEDDDVTNVFHDMEIPDDFEEE